MRTNRSQHGTARRSLVRAVIVMLAALVAAGSASAAAQPPPRVPVAPTDAAQAPAVGRSAQVTPPTVSILSPTAGATLPDGRVVVRGRYTSGARVTAVTVVACRPSSPTTCKDFLLAASNGGLAKRWRGMPARIQPDSVDGRTGWFSLMLTGLPGARLRITAFASDVVTPKGVATAVGVSMKAPADPSYISVLFGRANWVAAGGEGCTNRPATARTLEQNAIDLADRGIPGVAQVVTSRIADTTHLCPDNFALEASWQDLARLRDGYGWTLTSQSRSYPNLTQLDEREIVSESADSLPFFTRRGHDRAWGSFAYPANQQNARVHGIVMRYFGFGRVYAQAMNTRQSATAFPYPMRTLSVNGGRCRNPELACSTMAVENDRATTSPAAIATLLKPGPGKWGVVQFYRIVEGAESRMGATLAWDCTPADWQDRWTSQPELYCRNSMLQALDLRNKSATAVDPATVALAWNRRPWGR